METITVASLINYEALTVKSQQSRVCQASLVIIHRGWGFSTGKLLLAGQAHSRFSVAETLYLDFGVTDLFLLIEKMVGGGAW